jgi:hypothetical protein
MADIKSTEIPTFDLTEQILAEQRKISSIKRKGPVKKNAAPVQQQQVRSIGYTAKAPPLLSEQEQIIADIVARDIKTLLAGSSISG